MTDKPETTRQAADAISASAAAALIGVKPSTIAAWERRGWLARLGQSPDVDRNGRPLAVYYSREEILRVAGQRRRKRTKAPAPTVAAMRLELSRMHKRAERKSQCDALPGAEYWRGQEDVLSELLERLKQTK